MFYRFGLVGENISYSLSPAIFEWGLREAGLSGEYRVHDISLEELPLLIRQKDWDGLSVTVPYKRPVYELCSDLTARASITGAVNTLYRKKNNLYGDNTDVLGFQLALSRRWIYSDDVRRALIIGSGGAARAVLVALGQSFAPLSLTVACRNPESARDDLGSLLDQFIPVQCCSLDQASHELASFDLVVQATPVGGVRVPGSVLPKPWVFKKNALVFDLIYAPRITEFLKTAEKCGADTENGLVMLIAQAAASFEIWTRMPFPLEHALKNLLPELQAA
ncbi:shikimate dehydrogenase [candidate division KSB1 bacterium]|nr:MAG: shikimate dehydrogenase [candidate division KSB1 bacterium]